MITPNLSSTEITTLKSKIEDVDFAMLTTLERDGDFHSRPMYTFEMEADGSLWFMPYGDSHKVQEIQFNSRIGLSYSEPGSETYVAAAGTAEVIRDQTKIDQLWVDPLKAWFPNGKDDPNIVLLKIKLHQAEYWDRTGGKMAKLFQVAKAYVTGDQDRGGENKKLGEEPQ